MPIQEHEVRQWRVPQTVYTLAAIQSGMVEFVARPGSVPDVVVRWPVVFDAPKYPCGFRCRTETQLFETLSAIGAGMVLGRLTAEYLPEDLGELRTTPTLPVGQSEPSDADEVTPVDPLAPVAGSIERTLDEEDGDVV